MKKSFYAVIPSEVLTDDQLTDFEKLLYALISSLANSKGYAFATNSYFEKAFNKSERTVRYAISKLIEKELIVSVVFPDKGNQRRLYLSTALPLGQSVAPPLGQSVAPPSYKKKTYRKGLKQAITKPLNIEWFTQYLLDQEKQNPSNDLETD
jgi:SOS-response transcriptional repressor LexA